MAGTRGGPSGVPGGVWAQPLPPAPVLGPAAAPGAVGMVAPWGCRPHRDAGPMGWDVAELGAGSGLLHPSAPRPSPVVAAGPRPPAGSPSCPPPAPRGPVPAPTPFSHGWVWSRSPQAWATPKPPGSVPEVPQSRAGERGQGQHRAPSVSGVGPKAQGRGAPAPPKPRGPVRSLLLLQGPKPGENKGVRKPNQRSAKFNEFKV